MRGPVKGYKQTPEHKRNVIAGKGLLNKEEYIASQKKISNDYWNSPGAREAARERLAQRRAKGEQVCAPQGHTKRPLTKPRKPVSEETRRLISKIHTGMRPSAETLIRLSESHKGIPAARRGPKHHWWKDGGTYSFRGEDWSRVKKEILKRDEYTCQACGKTKPNVRLVVHHITEWQYTQDNHPTNLITLCNSCHQKHHLGLLCILVMALPT